MRPVSITNPDHFVNVARRRAAQEPNSIFADQFENLANFRAHLQTGQELWQQCRQQLHGFVCGAGTGGTIAGISTYLKQQCSSVQIFLIDPPGSSLYNKVPCLTCSQTPPSAMSGVEACGCRCQLLCLLCGSGALMLTLSILCLLGHSKVHVCSGLQVQPSAKSVMKLADYFVAKALLHFSFLASLICSLLR